jgi:hypothetical protein
MITTPSQRGDICIFSQQLADFGLTFPFVQREPFVIGSCFVVLEYLKQGTSRSAKSKTLPMKYSCPLLVDHGC